MRVVIVGSGLSGLVMGHCLLKAGIDDFVILERRPDPMERSGSVIGFFPHTFRILDQLGLLKDFRQLSEPVHHWIHLDPRGRTISDGEFFDRIQANHGYFSMFFMRCEVMELLYSKLPNRERYVLPNKKVTAVKQDDSSVTVTCADGSVYEGDVLVGCDGVHSAVRRLAFPPSTEKPKAPPRSEYRGLFGSSPLPDGVPPCNLTETHDTNTAFTLLCTEKTAFWLVTDLKDKDAPAVGRYSEEDILALVDRCKDHSVAAGAAVTFGDLWRTRNLSPGPGMYDYNEGVAEKWHDGRAVIVGDAAHSMTPNIGQGGNNAIQSVASFVNHLRAVAQEKPNPEVADLEKAFAGFQKERKAPAEFITGITGKYTRWTSYRTWSGWFIQSWLWPLLGDRFVIDRLLSPVIKDSVKLDFVELKNPPAGRVPWTHA
ncbi:uncharacterized protein B0H64DRAFT_386005 [Chaetomium fimeti]|uniref:FAD-binding domain-containing protein n=1 Tax=Chaetomium fimeti TaxID=1854472 RepID=A0AAE0LVD7_9PEZI|nr:hypothetical protein B0H64DRAFT_386005 [Chaetomium fimeti]